MRVRVLGSSAGGGFPQWNCNCLNCRRLRTGSIQATPRTQSSIAVAGSAANFFALLNASPDIGVQIRDWPLAQPGRAQRDTAIAAIILVDSQIDHSAGLLSLRENKQLNIYCTDPVFEDLTNHLSILNALESYIEIKRYPISLKQDDSWSIAGINDLAFAALPVHGKAPPYSPRRENGVIGDNIAVQITDQITDKELLYAPGVQIFDEALHEAACRADCIMIDGTFWTDDEMIALGISNKLAHEMGHLQLTGNGGMIEHLKLYPKSRRILIHINNTNPILDHDSPERRILDDLGIEVAFDGMEFVL